MRRLPRWSRTLLGAALVTVLATGAAGCGQDPDDDADAKADRAVEDCRQQWREVGETVVGMDQDEHPSALPDRWTSVIATVEYYKTVDTAENCEETLEAQLESIALLRQFTDKLRPYDMTYQLSQVRAAIDLYLHEPLPEPVRGENGKLVRPPSKAAVAAAMQTLESEAAQANAELAPGWEQTSAVDVTDVEALTKAVQDLDFLAQDSPHWVRCEEALQVLVAAIRAQEGIVGAPSTGPTDATQPG